MKKYAAIFAAAAMFFVQSPALCAEKAADESVFEEIYGTVKESVPPREIDKAAYELHRNYSSGKSSPPPQMGRGGTVVYAFGTTVPRILCKPLRITDVELERGEVITNPPFIGDGVNWQIMPSTSGKGDTLTFHIMIKPSMPDISTNLVVHTDRRTYHMELVSSAGRHIPHIAFSYPYDSDDTEWNKFLARVLARGEDEGFTPPHKRPETGGTIDAGYEVTAKSKNIPWLPTRVYNDGHKTYIVFPEALASTEAPVFMLLRGKSKEIVNYRLMGNTYVIDYVVEKGILTSGSGKGAKSAVISRVQKNRKKAVSGGESEEKEDRKTELEKAAVQPSQSGRKYPFPLSLMNSIDSAMGGNAAGAAAEGKNKDGYTFEDYLNERRSGAERAEVGK